MFIYQRVVILECQSLANFQKSVICSFQPHTMIPGNSGPRTAAIPAMSFSGWLQLGPQHSPEEPSNKSCQKGLKLSEVRETISPMYTNVFLCGGSQLAPDLQGRQQRAAREEAVGQRAVSAAAGDAQKAQGMGPWDRDGAVRCFLFGAVRCVNQRVLGRNHPVICF